MQHSHRSSLKQSNKEFKSRHSTKGALKRENKGKVNRVSLKTRSVESHKVDRRNASKIEQKKKRLERTLNSRNYNGLKATPKIVAIVPLCHDVDATLVVQALFNSVEKEEDKLLVLERFKQRLQLLPTRRDVLEILDACKIADFIIFLLSANEEVDKFGEHCMSLIKTQGLPHSISMVQHLDDHPAKMQHAIRNSLTYYMSHHFPEEDRLYSITNQNECINALRHITSQVPKGIKWRDRHPYIVADQVDVFPNADGNLGSLHVTGFIRGNNLDANKLVHIPDYGDFQIEKITLKTIKRSENDMDEDRVLQVADPETRQDLVSFNEIDPMDAEQTWPTEDEIREADERVKRQEHLKAETPFGTKKRVPKGTSSYQAAWIVDEEVSEDENENEDSEMIEDLPDRDETPEPDGEEYEEIDLDNRSIHFDALDEEEEKEQLEEYLRAQEAKDHQEFPDEIDTPQEIPARQRFARYRGLKSFKNSSWDPYENLPEDYGRIFQFQNFRRSKKRAVDSMDEGVPCGTYVTVEIKNFPIDFVKKDLFCIFGILPYEQKTSIINYVLKPTQGYTGTIKSKDKMIFMSGFRRFVCQPLYSTYTRGGSNNVHKFERYLNLNQPSVATIYAPIQFGPSPVMVFKYESNTSWSPDRVTPLVATGNVLDMDPLRIIAKRVILTGHPYKVHKRGAVVRYMFFDPEDVTYFKPVQLLTKHGRIGHIRESLGTHGYMKCIFDGPVKQHDTVQMMLYKRVFPKFTTEIWKKGQDFEMKDLE